MNKTKYVIGFSNLEERSEYAITVRESLEKASQKYADIELLVRNNNLDDDTAINNATNFAESNVDVAIVYHINEKLGSTLRSILLQIPTICVDIPIPLTTYVGIDNAGMGQQLGKNLTIWINQQWAGNVGMLVGLIDSRVRFAHPRILETVETIKQNLHLDDVASLFLDMRHDYEKCYQLIEDIVKEEANGTRNVIILAYNDVSAKCALDVLRAYNNPAQIVVVAQGITEDMLEMVNDPKCPLILGSLSHPEKYGDLLMQTAMQLINKERPQSKIHVPITFISPEK